MYSDSVRGELARAQEAITSLTSRLHDANTRMEELSRENDQLSERVASLTGARNRLEELSRENEQLLQQVASLTGANEALMLHVQLSINEDISKTTDDRQTDTCPDDVHSMEDALKSEKERVLSLLTQNEKLRAGLRIACARSEVVEVQCVRMEEECREWKERCVCVCVRVCVCVCVHPLSAYLTFISLGSSCLSVFLSFFL
jgi:chromosome segregation ATPase